MAIKRKIDGIRYAVMHAGTQKELAGVLNVHKTTVNKWVCKGYVPDDQVRQIHEMYKIPRMLLCNPVYLEVIFGEGADIDRMIDVYKECK